MPFFNVSLDLHLCLISPETLFGVDAPKGLTECLRLLRVAAWSWVSAPPLLAKGHDVSRALPEVLVVDTVHKGQL